uniref:Uncharacterized protein n=1 Tax=Glossina pallidipes TaxID=7398 RepID=A0A1A9Z4P5_GLOPL
MVFRFLFLINNVITVVINGLLLFGVQIFNLGSIKINWFLEYVWGRGERMLHVNITYYIGQNSSSGILPVCSVDRDQSAFVFNYQKLHHIPNFSRRQTTYEML